MTVYAADHDVFGCTVVLMDEEKNAKLRQGNWVAVLNYKVIIKIPELLIIHMYEKTKLKLITEITSYLPKPSSFIVSFETIWNLANKFPA